MKLKKTVKAETSTEIKESKGKALFGHSESKEEQHKPKYTDLREIMDYDRQFTMFYSGVESENYFKGCYDMGVRDFLMSYHYLQKSRVPLNKKYGDLGIKIFIDSGAYTYQADPKYREFTPEPWEKQIVDYLNWARRNKDCIFAIANLDLENLLGVDIVREWNEKYFEPFMLETGIPVCFIWHPICGDDGWERYCARYPYVGLSWVADDGTDLDFAYGVDKLKVAEKYNSLVHGMGMTRTALLPKLPFYTVDSTTWKSGFRYGQIAVWDGKRTTLKNKEDFETKVFPLVKNYDINPPIDLDLIRQFYEPEVLRCNVHAYLKAEEFIRQQLKPLTYWQKPIAKKMTEADLDSIKYPSIMWIENSLNEPDWEDYAKSFNISTADRNMCVNCIIDLTIFMNWDDEEYQPFIQDVYTPELIKQLHDTWVNRIVYSDEDRIRDLKAFFKDVLLGNTDKLLVLGTNFDRIVKERESYVTDEEYETEDVSEMELNNTMMKYLPAPKEGSHAPEISELDDEIFREEGIEPVRDAHGRFIKGQKQVLKPKKMYSNKYPKMACDSCVNAQRCPEYKAGYACAYNKMFERFNTRDMGDIIQAMQGIVDFSLVRLQRGMMTETMSGGIPDPNVSNMMNQTMGLLTQLQRMYASGSQEIIRQTKVLRADGTQETTTQVSNPQQGGILEKIFGNMGKEEPKEDNVVDVQ